MAKLTGVAKHRALFKLRGLLTWRRYTAERGRFVGLVIAFLFFVPTILGMSAGSWFGYTHAPDNWPFQILGMVLVALWAGWVIFPVLVAPLSEGVSLEQLLVYPLARRDLVLSNLIGSFYDYSTYMILPFFVAMFVAFGGFGRFSHPSTSLLFIPLLFVITLLAYGHMIVTSQLAMTALGGILQSRRMRDMAIAFFSLMGLGCWASSQLITLVIERFEEVLAAEQFFTIQPQLILRWFPTGALASAVEQAANGAWGQSILWIAYSTVLLIGLGWLWGLLLERLLTGDGFLINFLPAAEPEQTPQVVRKQADWSWLERWISAETVAIARKEFQMAWRVPQRRLNTIMLFIMPIMAGVAPLLTIDELSEFTVDPTNILVVYPLYSLFIFLALSQNMLGWEHNGLPTLLLTPVSRHRIFLGKSLMMIILGSIPLSMLTVLVIATSGSWIYLFWLVAAVLIGLLPIAVGSVVSAMFPYPVQLDYERNRNSMNRAGCIAMLMLMIPAPIIMVALSTPLVATFLIYRIFPQFNWAIVPLALVGAAVALASFWYGTRWAGNLLLEREPEAIEDARPTKGD
ncbi:MAG: hypothetical protein ACPG8W_04160 [Candidatus Promineifilaceae bacterium]